MKTAARLDWANKMIKAHEEQDHSNKTTTEIKVKLVTRVLRFLDPRNPF